MTLQNDVTIAYDRVALEPAPAPEPAEPEGGCEGGYVAPDSR